MKNRFIFLLLIFFVAGGICNAKNKRTSPTGNCCSIAYVNIEVLLQQYDRIVDLAKEKEERSESNNALLNKEKASFDKALKEFQQNIENNSFSSIDAADKEHKRLLIIESNLKKQNDTMQQTEVEIQEIERQQIEKLIKEATEKYNQTAKFEFILTKKGIDNIMFANPEFDITEAVLLILNTEYATEKEKAKNQ